MNVGAGLGTLDNSLPMAKRSFRDEVGRSKSIAHLLPESLTQAGFWFLLQAYRITTTFHAYQWMSKFLSSTEWLMEDYAEFLEGEGDPLDGSDGSNVDYFQTLNWQMIWADEIHFSKIVDTVLSYLVDLIACAYRHNPDLIPSRTRFDLDFVRRFTTINDAIRGAH